MVAAMRGFRFNPFGCTSLQPIEPPPLVHEITAHARHSSNDLPRQQKGTGKSNQKWAEEDGPHVNA
jgi:hypothetical protein